MTLGRSKLLVILAIFGFAIGASAYILFDLFFANYIPFTLPTIVSLLNAPWFLFGIVGSTITLVAILILAKTANK